MALATRGKPTVHHKKRTGEHQRRSKEFKKAYWPYLPLLGIAAIAIIGLGGYIIGPSGAVFGTITVSIAAIALLI
jgi:hypothetical protein